MIDLLRYGVIVTGLIVIGFNISMIANANRITAAYHAFRSFIIFKTGLTAYVVLDQYSRIDRSAPVQWRFWIAFISLAGVVISMIWFSREYSKIPYGRRAGDGIEAKRRDDVFGQE